MLNQDVGLAFARCHEAHRIQSAGHDVVYCHRAVYDGIHGVMHPRMEDL